MYTGAINFYYQYDTKNMSHIIKSEHGYTIVDTVAYLVDEPVEGLISLGATLGDAMKYTKSHYTHINFPGEYDINGVFVRAFVGKGDQMSYIVTIENDTYGLIQTKDVLQRDDVNDCDYRCVVDDTLVTEIEQMEFEWETVDLRAI